MSWILFATSSTGSAWETLPLAIAPEVELAAADSETVGRKRRPLSNVPCLGDWICACGIHRRPTQQKCDCNLTGYWVAEADDIPGSWDCLEPCIGYDQWDELQQPFVPFAPLPQLATPHHNSHAKSEREGLDADSDEPPLEAHAGHRLFVQSPVRSI